MDTGFDPTPNMAENHKGSGYQPSTLGTWNVWWDCWFAKRFEEFQPFATWAH